MSRSREPRAVLAVARTITSAVRLLDELDVLRGDDRITVSFWLDERSRFSHGARDLLLQRGVRILTDEEQRKQSFDLILTALGLPPREQTPHRAWPAAHVDAATVASFQVRTSSRPDGSLRIERFPAAVGAYLPEAVRTSSHLATYDDELDLGRRDSASVMLSRSVREPAQAREWLEEHSRQRLLAAVAEPGNTVRVSLRGQRSRVTGSGDAALVSAALHHLARHGNPRGPVRATLGPTTVKLEISSQ